MPPAALAGAYRASWLLRNGHVQTVLPNLPPWRSRILRRARGLRAQASRWLLDCGAGVRLEAWHTPAARADAPCAVLLHGWEGSVDSCYLLSLGATLHARGYQVLRLHLRDHGGTQHLNEGLFHSCRLDDVTGALRAIAVRLGDTPLCLAGFSLGGNFLLRAAAEPALPASVAGVVAISPVLDPDRTLHALEHGWWAYHRYFVDRWSASLRAKQRAWPGSYDFAPLVADARLRPMTDRLVRAHTSFPDLHAYLGGYAITGARLQTLAVPAAMLLAEDDPIIPVADHARLAPTPLLQVTRTRHGGHCGFIAGLGGGSWVDAYACAHFARWLANRGVAAPEDGLATVAAGVAQLPAEASSASA
jgi:predicted alpha/beta-fold hydrolase